MTFTILGASGFIGSNLARHLRLSGHEVFAPSRDSLPPIGRDLGHVIYCIGMTADFRRLPMETFKAHVCRLIEILENVNFESFLYLSSSRIYNGINCTNENETLKINPQNTSDLYNISKLAGEAICFAVNRPNVRVVRLSNVYGADFNSENFLSAIIRDALTIGSIHLNTSLDSNKDYISLSDVLYILPQIALHGKMRLYNVASGINTDNSELVGELKRITNCNVLVEPDAPLISFPRINIERVRDEFDFSPKSLINSLPDLVNEYRLYYSKT